MFPRVGGAILAFAAAIALTLSVAIPAGVLPTSAWWSGHPEVNGRTITAKTVHIGPLMEKGCNTGGNGECEELTLGGAFTTTARIEAGVAGLLALLVIVLGLLTWSQKDGRKTVAKLVVGAAVIAAIVAVAMIVQGPDIQTSVKDLRTPIGYGMFVFWGGIASAMTASVFAMRPTPPVRLKPAGWTRGKQVRPFGAAPSSAMPQQPVDVHALMQEDALRPAALGPEPMMGRASSPGGGLPGPTGALGQQPGPSSSSSSSYPGGGGGQSSTMPGQQPLFSSAPQLRPLYDAAPGQGGTGGFVPQQQARFPISPPTPIPRNQISAIAGIPTPPPFDVARPLPPGFLPPPRPQSSTRPPPFVPPAPVPTPSPFDVTDDSPAFAATAEISAVSDLEPPPLEHAETAQVELMAPPDRPAVRLPPPTRMSAPQPATPPRPPTHLERDRAQLPPARPLPGTSPPPISRAMPSPTQPPPAAKPAPNPSLMPPISRSLPSPTRPPPVSASRVNPTIAHSSVPPPPERMGKPVVPFPAPGTVVPDRALTEAEELREDSVLAKLGLDVGSVGENFDASTTESLRPGADDHDDQVETRGREKMTTTDLDLPVTPPPPAAVAPEPEHEPESAVAAVEEPAEETAAPAAPKDLLRRGARAFGFVPGGGVNPPPSISGPATQPPASSPAKVPLSTAPDSLPPPNEKQSATSGPSPACPQCEAPMAWVEEHLRFYCKSCKMYF